MTTAAQSRRWKQGLAPQIGDDCRVLILGSMPGEASLLAGQYYAHPRNRFWPLLGKLYGFDPALPYMERLQFLRHARVGLWDVLDRCEREGSLDSAIRTQTEMANPLLARLRTLPDLRRIAFNGAKAAQTFRRHVLGESSAQTRLARIDCQVMPSTSPANASFGMERLWTAWAALREP
jgi:hypoxanthine-DNA glycosylase